MPAVGKFERQREPDDNQEKMIAGHGLSALQNDAFNDVGDVFTFVDGGFDDFENFLPLDDLDRVSLLVEKLGDERAADAVALVFVAIDFNAVLEGVFRRAEGMNR